MTTPDQASPVPGGSSSPGFAPPSDASAPTTATPFASPEPQPGLQPLAPVVTSGTHKRKGTGAGNALLMVAVLVAAGGIAFAIGRSTAPASTSSNLAGGFAAGPNASFVPGDGAQGGPGGFGGSMTLTGTVTSVDGSTLTIQTSDGQTVTVDTSGATYHAQAAASASDVTTGSTIDVSVTGLGPAARPDASAAPDASASTGSGLTASDVTIVSP